MEQKGVHFITPGNILVKNLPFNSFGYQIYGVKLDYTKHYKLTFSITSKINVSIRYTIVDTAEFPQGEKDFNVYNNLRSLDEYTSFS